VQLSPPREELVRKKRTTLCVLPERTLHGGFQAVLLSRSVPDCIFREERLSCLQAPGGGRGIRKLTLQLVEFSYLSYRLNEHKTRLDEGTLYPASCRVTSRDCPALAWL
jgi:hypothetical protein